jgi:IS4 transposase
MYEGKLVFAQLMEQLPLHVLRRSIARYDGDRYVKGFSCQDQFRCMAFAQFTYRDSLRDTITCLNAQSAKLYHMGIRGTVSRSTLADANETRDWRIYAAFAHALIAEACKLYAGDQVLPELTSTAYALDTTTIDLCLSLFPWAPFRRGKAALKLHTMLDLRGNIPVLVHIGDGRSYDTEIIDVMIVEPGAIYIMDRGFLDFARLRHIAIGAGHFIVRAKDGQQLKRIRSRAVDRSTGVICDQDVRLAIRATARKYPETLRRVRYRDPETGKALQFLTNNFVLPPLTIANLYRRRWHVELFFKWIKQHLRIKTFFGTGPNAAKTQIWIAVAVYVLIAIVRKRLRLEASPYTILQILSVTMFEKLPIDQLLSGLDPSPDRQGSDKQLNLFGD